MSQEYNISISRLIGDMFQLFIVLSEVPQILRTKAGTDKKWETKRGGRKKRLEKEKKNNGPIPRQTQNLYYVYVKNWNCCLFSSHCRDISQLLIHNTGSGCKMLIAWIKVNLFIFTLTTVHDRRSQNHQQEEIHFDFHAGPKTHDSCNVTRITCRSHR